MKNKFLHIIKVIAMLMIIPLVITAFVYGKKINDNDVVQDIAIQYMNEYKFIDELDVKEICLNQDVLLKKTMIKELNLDKFEQTIRKNVWAKNVEVYLTANNVLKIQLEQKKPIARVVLNDSSSSSYYIDEQGNPFPESIKYRPKIPLITGKKIGFDKKGLLFHEQLKKISMFIHQDSFWKNMITQINLRDNNDIELITTIGDATVLFGDANNIEDKFSRLFQFYKYKFYEADWMAIKEIDVRFNRQVICRRDGTAPDVNYFKSQDSNALYKNTIALANVKNNAVVNKTTILKPNLVTKPIPKKELKIDIKKSKNSVLTKKIGSEKILKETKPKVETANVVLKKENPVAKIKVVKELPKEAPKENKVEIKKEELKKSKPIIISSEPTKN